ncbi:AAA family ATPase [Micromonospora aurantiaca (nom. illeg.)]|uniref:ATP-binding protein n=1 Tax=Micromonospora aurantiaca (nom. illeg.) TaxID=47850 RepID=A0ABQ6UKU3_9ACTN|nr:AAA family ATPase [Micromonospora aurantiaca]KAB1117405.1 ATP-binding protein [Micromonospora aurantiaca]UFN93999.1 ATP-binding protein [Micromonospora aurantiaca]
MAIDFWISSLTFSDRTRVLTPAQGITVIVGPNNSGKTVTLHGLINSLASPHSKSEAKVVRDVSFETKGTVDDLHAWLQENAHKERNMYEEMYRRMGQQVRWHELKYGWENAHTGHIGPHLANYLTFSADVDSRAGIVGGQVSSGYMDDIPSSPVAFLYYDGDLEQKFSKICESAFGMPITLQRLSSSSSLRLGVPDAEVPPVNRPTKAYADAERALPALGEQGHGMRSFMGLALTMLVQNYFVITVDEPEAFLHPPQRRALGRLLSELATNSGSQLFIATHDTDFLWGLLDGPAEVTVVRLTRDGDVNHAKQIDAEQAKSLWTDPLLRYSRIFDGLFYNRVVVAESDSDCRFFGAVVDYLVDERGVARPDVLFVPAGGKDRIHVAVSALRSVGVDVVAAVDFDMFRDEQGFKRLVEACGGTWEEFAQLRTRFAGPISAKRVAKPISGLRKKLDSILPGDEADLDRETSKAVTALFSFKDGWEEAKDTGLESVPHGDAYLSCELLLSKLTEIGVFVSPNGELESFVKGVGGHGPKWVNAVLSKGLQKRSATAHRFVRQLIER